MARKCFICGNKSSSIPFKGHRLIKCEHCGICVCDDCMEDGTLDVKGWSGKFKCPNCHKWSKPTKP